MTRPRLLPRAPGADAFERCFCGPRPAGLVGPVVLVGDAAHATLPAGAGAGLAMKSPRWRRS